MRLDEQTDMNMRLEEKRAMRAMVFFGCIAAMLCVGCSENSIEIINLADGAVILNFRGEGYRVEPEATMTVSDVPNGTYEYGTTYYIPYATITTWQEGPGLSGTMSFRLNRTKMNIQYASVITTDGVYQIDAAVTSSDRLDPVSPIEQ